jgi:hypothetical protein
VFYLALGYFISYLPYALLAKALSSGIIPGVETHCLADSDIPEPAAASLDDHRHIAALIQQAVQKRLAERFL